VSTKGVSVHSERDVVPDSLFLESITRCRSTSSSGPISSHDGPFTFSALAGLTSKAAVQFKTASNPTRALTQVTACKEELAALRL